MANKCPPCYRGDRQECRNQRASQCEQCSTKFTQSCSRARTCSKSCSSKFTKKASKGLATCQGCGIEFHKRTPEQVHCRQLRTFFCQGCGTEFKTECLGKRSRFHDAKCRNSWMRANRYSLEERTCLHCGHCYQPTTWNQELCGDDVIPCEVCGEDFKITPQRWKQGSNRACDAVCRGLLASKIPSERVKEYKNINGWAAAFKINTGRNPMPEDVRNYFDVLLIPGHANPSLFNRRRRRFEDVVVAVVTDAAVGNGGEREIRRNKRPLVDPATGGRLELDIWLPELSLAFEVQDILTHSRTSDDESCSGHLEGKPKKGPSYHENKRALAMEQLGVTLVDIWEDEILDGSYREMIIEAIAAADRPG